MSIIPVALFRPCFCPIDSQQTRVSGKPSMASNWSLGSLSFVLVEYFASLGGTNPLQQKKTFIRSDLQQDQSWRGKDRVTLLKPLLPFLVVTYTQYGLIRNAAFLPVLSVS